MQEKKSLGGFLDFVERVGNKIPHTFILFVFLTIIVVLLSAGLAAMGVKVVNPATQKVFAVKSLMSTEGLLFFLKNMTKNFIGFSPLGLVLVMALGIGIAEHTGMLFAMMRHAILSIKASPFVLTYIIFVVGICSNIASDAAYAIMPPLCGMIFLVLGRHPLAGVAMGFAAAAAGFTANIMVAGTDALVAGISTEAVKAVMPGYVVPVTANYFFMLASTFIMGLVGAFVSLKIVEPRLGKYTGTVHFDGEQTDPREKEALKFSAKCTAAYLLILAAVIAPADSFMRNPKTGSLLRSPFMDSLVPLIFFLFLIAGVSYGVKIGKIKVLGDIPKLMTTSIRDLSGFIVLVFMMGQFVACFNWTNISIVLAVNGAEVIKNMNLSGYPLFIMFILLTAFVNFFMTSGAAKWTIFAPIFIPMFYMLGYTPEFTQLLYRIGDSPFNPSTPLSAFMPLIIGFMQRYDEKAGMGTVISCTMPFSIWMLIVWIAMIVVWTALALPIGPGVDIYLPR